MATLSANTYTVIVSDRQTDCEGQVTFTLVNDVAQATISIENNPRVSCAGASDARVDYNIATLPDFNGPATVLILDAAGMPHGADQLAAGEYCLIVFDAAGCYAGEECFTITQPEALSASFNLVDADCDNGGSIELSIAGGTAPHAFHWADLGNNGPQQRSDLAAGIYPVRIVDAQGCELVLDQLLVNDACQPCPQIAIDTILVLDPHCGQNDGRIQIEMVGSETAFDYFWSPNVSTTSLAENLAAGSYYVTIADTANISCQLVDTIVLSDRNGPTISIDSLAPANCTLADGWLSLLPRNLTYTWEDGYQGAERGNLPGGVYRITGVDQNGCSGSLEVALPTSCPTLDTIYLTTPFETPVDTCLDWGELPAPLDTSLFCGLPHFGSLLLNPNDSCVQYIPFDGYVGNDTTCVVLCDELGICDTTIIVVTVLPENCGDFIFLSDTALVLNDCNENVDLCVDLPLLQIREYNILFNGNIYTGDVEPCRVENIKKYPCFNIPDQGTSGPYEVEYWLVNEDTVRFQFLTLNDLADSMNRYGPASNWQFDYQSYSILGGDEENSYGAMRVRHDLTGATARLDWSPIPLPGGTQFELGVGDHELVFTHQELGCTDTVHAIVACISPEIRVDTIDLGEQDSICVDLSELVGTPNALVNLCEDASGEYVVFETEPDEFCIYAEGMEVGMDSACMIVCDEYGLCDTTYLFVHVVDPDNPYPAGPVAVQDVDTTFQNTPITVAILNNDTINGNLDTLYVLDAPRHGTVLLDDNRVQYQPEEEYCDPETPDQFSYVICNEYGCDSTTVQIIVLCKDLAIYSGFSPNGDGKNDAFIIQGIEKYPNSRLMIFNRWGNEVYQKEGYLNDWEGTWNGKPLPDGTYFYVLDDGEGHSHSGYVQIHR